MNTYHIITWGGLARAQCCFYATILTDFNCLQFVTIWRRQKNLENPLLLSWHPWTFCNFLEHPAGLGISLNFPKSPPKCDTACACSLPGMTCGADCADVGIHNNNNSRRLLTLAEHTSDHGKQTNSITKEWGDKNKKTTKDLLLKTCRLKLELPIVSTVNCATHSIYS